MCVRTRFALRLRRPRSYTRTPGTSMTTEHEAEREGEPKQRQHGRVPRGRRHQNALSSPNFFPGDLLTTLAVYRVPPLRPFSSPFPPLLPRSLGSALLGSRRPCLSPALLLVRSVPGMVFINKRTLTTSGSCEHSHVRCFEDFLRTRYRQLRRQKEERSLLACSSLREIAARVGASYV